MKTKFKIAVLAMMGMSLGVNAQTETINSGDLRFTGNRDNKIILNGDNTLNKPSLLIGEQNRYGVGFKWDSGLNLNIIQFDNQDVFSSTPTKLGHFRIRDKEFYWSGNVGIGTTSPKGNLQINGTSEASSSSRLNGQLILSSSSTGLVNTFGIHTKSGVNAYSWIQSGHKTLSNTYDLALNPRGGNVGIGTINPDMELTVNGKIHAKEVKIDLAIPAPDYVFKSDYKLRSIEEVEFFIKEHSHLPEIPSAKEFAENGVMQAEMDMNLLKKIEELTLYTIEQEKKIKKLEKRNSKIDKQQKEIEELKALVQKLLKDKN